MNEEQLKQEATKEISELLELWGSGKIHKMVDDVVNEMFDGLEPDSPTLEVEGQ